MTHLLLILLTLLPWSHFLFRPTVLNSIDIWHTHAMFFQLMMCLCVGYSIYRPSIKPTILKRNLKNLPFGLLCGWIGITCIYRFSNVMAIYALQKPGTVAYNYPLLAPLFNFIGFIFLYKFILDYLNSKNIDKILKWMSVSIGFVLIYGLIQQLNLDQFYRNIGSNVKTDSVIGTIGNTTHFAGWISICLPILYYIKAKWTSVLIPIAWIVILLTGSASGLIGALLITIFYNCFFKIRFKYEWVFYVILIGLAGLFAIYKNTEFITLFNSSGRIAFWKHIWVVFKTEPITGAGLGKLVQLWPMRVGTVFEGWRHVHNEFYQMMIEIGLIGLGIIIYGILHCLKRFKRTEQSVCLMSIFIGFLINCLFGYPAHLYSFGILGMFSYAGIYCLEEE